MKVEVYWNLLDAARRDDVMQGGECSLRPSKKLCARGSDPTSISLLDITLYLDYSFQVYSSSSNRQNV
jgi:hypothetical protein